MTKIRIESDSESDKGKSFGGQEIKVVPKRKKKSGGGSSSKSGNTTIYIVSDAPEDRGRSFGGQQIITSQQFSERKRSSSSSVASREVSAQERNEIQNQIKAEQQEKERQRVEQREKKIERIEQSSAREDLNQRIQAGVSSEIRDRQQDSSIQQSNQRTGNLPSNNADLNSKIQAATRENLRKQNSNKIDLSGTSTPAQINQLTNQEAQNIQGTETTFSFSAPEEGQTNLNPLRFVVAPAALVYRTVSSGGGNIVQGGKDLVTSVKSEGLVSTGKNIVVGTARAAATDPFGFVGEGAAFGGAGKVAKQAFSKATTKVQPITSSSESLSVATREGSLGIEKIDIKAQYEVQTGLIRRKTEIVDVQADGIINKEVRSLGNQDPIIQRPVENPLSTEFSRTTVGEGMLEVNVEGFGQTNSKVNFFQQGNKQIVEVDKSTSISKTESVGKLNNEEIFKTTSRDLKTGDKEVTLSKEVKPFKEGTTLSDDLFAGASKSETDIYIKNKDLKPTPEKIVDVDASSVSSKLELPSPPKDIQVIKPPKQKGSGNKGSNDGPSSSSPSRSGTQQQMFKMESKSQNSGLSVTNKAELSAKLKVETVMAQRRTNVQIPSQVVRDVIIKRNSKVSKTFPAFAATIKAMGNKKGFAQPQDIMQSQVKIPATDKLPATAEAQDKLPGVAQDQPQAQGDLFDNPTPNKGKNINDQIIKGPGSPRFPIRPKFPPKAPFKMKFGPTGLKPKNNAAYDVFIRENGKRIKANKKPIPYNLALRKGTNIVDNTIAASFEVQQRGTTSIPDIPSQTLGNKFRARKTKNALRVVEKSKNRIDTVGEKQGLSVAKFMQRLKL